MRWHLFAAVVGISCAGSKAPHGSNAESSPPVIHTVEASAQGLGVNCYLVEGPTSVVAIDSALTISDSRALRAKLDALGKPLAAVLVTHGHPDHYNGIHYLIEGKTVPVYATAPVAKVIRDDDEAKEKQWKPVFGDEWPPIRAFPDHEVHDGEHLTFDGMVFIAHDLGPGESHADSFWELTGAAHAAFIGDVVLNGEHAYTNDGHTAEWLKNLDAVKRSLPDIEMFYPGHGAAGDVSILDWEATYLVAYRDAVESLRAGATSLSDAQKAALVEKMKARYPTAGLEFMITLGADTVAGELAHAQ